MLPAESVAQLSMADRDSRQSAVTWRSHVLSSRGGLPAWSWRTASAVESALWRHEPGHEWSQCCVAGLKVDEAWDDFQGWECAASAASDDEGSGLHPRWATFKIESSRLAPSGATLGLFSTEEGTRAASQKLAVSVFARRTEMRDGSQCLSLLLETCFAARQVQKQICIDARDGDEAYNVAIHFDWALGAVSLFVDGELRVQATDFNALRGVRSVGIYQKSTAFCTAMSDVILGKRCPFDLQDEHLLQPRGDLFCRRWRPHYAWMTATCRQLVTSQVFPFLTVSAVATSLIIAETLQ